jgi:hypothetical protein
MDDSSFNRLPAELRIKVYEYTLTFDRVSCGPRESSLFSPERSLSTQLALTRVCKQIRSECQDLPFTLNRLIVGAAPWQERFCSDRFFSMSELFSLADDVAQGIARIPPDLMSASTTLTLDMHPKAKSMFRYGLTPEPLIDRQLLADWIAIKLFVGRILRTTQAHGELLLDVTPGDEKIGLHLWCEAGDHDPSETGLESRYELLPAIPAFGDSPWDSIVAATFGCAPVRATMDRHRHHDRSLCNVAKHGEELLEQVAHLDYHAGAIIKRNVHVWNTSNSLRF